MSDKFIIIPILIVLLLTFLKGKTFHIAMGFNYRGIVPKIVISTGRGWAAAFTRNSIDEMVQKVQDDR